MTTETGTALASAVLLLGDPRLRERCAPVDDPRSPAVRSALERLHATLRAQRAHLGFGRAIAAPQIGCALRLVAFDLGQGARTLANPRIVSRSPATFTLWDDCLSFPELLVRVRRHRSIALEYQDEHGRPQRWQDLAPAESELFQHELDHLDGILALDRAIDRDSIVHRTVFEHERERFTAMVDHPA
jgi:peptide deformylase